MPDLDDYLSVAEAAEKAGISERGIRKAITSGNLQAIQKSGVWLIIATELERWQQDANAHKHGPKPPPKASA